MPTSYPTATKATGFNSQPPEGGWAEAEAKAKAERTGFNSQPPEGGWQAYGRVIQGVECFNSQPPEGGWQALLA